MRSSLGHPLTSQRSGAWPALQPHRLLTHPTTCHPLLNPPKGSGSVWVSEREALSIARHLSISLERFVQLYTMAYTKVKGWWLLKNDPTSGEVQMWWLWLGWVGQRACRWCGVCIGSARAVSIRVFSQLTASPRSTQSQPAFPSKPTTAKPKPTTSTAALSPAQARNCIFLRDNACSIHTVRPIQCSTYRECVRCLLPARLLLRALLRALLFSAAAAYVGTTAAASSDTPTPQPSPPPHPTPTPTPTPPHTHPTQPSKPNGSLVA